MRPFLGWLVVEWNEDHYPLDKSGREMRAKTLGMIMKSIVNNSVECE
jgi:hypothetical protein